MTVHYDVCTSEATKGMLAVGRQGRLPHDPLCIAHGNAFRRTLLLSASIRLIGEQSMAQQPVLCPFDLLQRGMRRHTLCNLVNLRRDVFLHLWVESVLEDLDAEKVWGLLVARVHKPLELRVLVQGQRYPIQREIDHLLDVACEVRKAR
eukprot:7046952-Prymnesium_polylepis.2